MTRVGESRATPRWDGRNPSRGMVGMGTGGMLRRMQIRGRGSWLRWGPRDTIVDGQSRWTGGIGLTFEAIRMSGMWCQTFLLFFLLRVGVVKANKQCEGGRKRGGSKHLRKRTSYNVPMICTSTVQLTRPLKAAGGLAGANRARVQYYTRKRQQDISLD
jgi:hypothetical protein